VSDQCLIKIWSDSDQADQFSSHGLWASFGPASPELVGQMKVLSTSVQYLLYRPAARSDRVLQLPRIEWGLSRRLWIDYWGITVEVSAKLEDDVATHRNPFCSCLDNNHRDFISTAESTPLSQTHHCVGGKNIEVCIDSGGRENGLLLLRRSGACSCWKCQSHVALVVLMRNIINSHIEKGFEWLISHPHQINPGRNVFVAREVHMFQHREN